MRYRRDLLLATTALLVLGVVVAHANPLGGQVVGGSATISGSGTATTTITQTTDKAIINWNTFNIGVGELTKFIQPGASSIALNRVTGGLGPSQIYGTLTANGRVFLVNPDGILFGQGAQINTGGFLATTSDIKNSDFMAGKNNFTIPGKPDASIVNLGNITVADTGIAALVAPGVRNSGTITANLGTVALASGNAFTLDFYGDKLITLQVGDSVAAQVKDVATGQTLDALVKNEGTVRANGGRVELTAAAARVVVDSVINNTGVIEANSVGTRNGMIVLGAATAADKPAGAPAQNVKVSGTLSAAGKKAGEKGGKIQITGEKIALAGAKIDASGRAGGGKVLIGGDVGGGNGNAAVASIPQASLEPWPVPTASTVSVDAASTINASALDSGDGGKLVVWSDNLTTFAGAFQARGGAASGDGGFAEVSSKGKLSYSGFGDLRAPAGKFGTLLLDPDDFVINSDSVGAITYTLDHGGNVTITTFATGTGGFGDITVDASVSWSTAANLTLSAYNNIFFATHGFLHSSGGGNIILRADNSGIGRPDSGGTVSFIDSSTRVSAANGGNVSIFYNPVGYTSPTSYSDNISVTGGGTFNAYMLVNSYWDLQDISSNLGGTYALGHNINGRDDPNFVPIGGTSGPFTGLFDGQGNTISNLTIAPTASGVSSIGLFAAIGSTGVVRDLNLSNINVTANPSIGLPGQFIGTLAGQNVGTISNVFVTGTVNGGTSPGVVAGGLVGQNGMMFNSDAGTITTSTANVSVTVGDGSSCTGSPCNGGFNSAGGLVGSNVAGSLISYSSAEGNVTGGSFSTLGGLVGQNGWSGFGSVAGTTGTINRSWASGAVSSAGTSVALGGLVGSNAPGSRITDSRASGDVTGSGTVPPTSGVNCANNPCPWITAGGLVGQNLGTITTSLDGPPTFVGSSYSYYDTPYSSACLGLTCASGNVFVGSHGTAGGLVGENFGTIRYAMATGSVTGAAGAPTDGTHPFDNSTTLGGLVGRNEGTITYTYATGSVGLPGTASLTAGGLVGSNAGSIDSSIAIGSIIAGSNSTAGGLVGDNSPNNNNCNGCSPGDGQNNLALITNSFGSGKVTIGTASVAGGLAGFNDGTLLGTGASGTVSGGSDSVLGGLVGVVGFSGTVTASVAVGDVSSSGPNSAIGGLIGYNAGSVSAIGSTGSVIGGSDSFIGGLVGINIGSISTAYVDPAAAGGPNPAVTGTGTNNVIGGLVGLNIGSIGTSVTTADVTTGANSLAGGLVGANATFTNVSIGTITGSSYPSGTIDLTTSTSSGTVVAGLGSTSSSTVGTSSPTSLPGFSSFVYPCTDPLCTALLSPLATSTTSTTSTTISTATFGTQQFAAFTPPPPGSGNNLDLTISSGTTDSSGGSGGSGGGSQPPSAAGPPPRTGPPPGPGIGRTASEMRYSGVPPLNETRFLPNEVVIQISNTVSADQIAALARELGITVVSSQTIDLTGRTIYRFHMADGSDIRKLILKLEQKQIVASAQPNYVFNLSQDAEQTGSLPPPSELQSDQADLAALSLPAGDSAQYVIDKLKLGTVHNLSLGRNVTVAVIDSEIDTQHPDLQGVIAGRFDATTGSSKPHTHGTGMAGAIAAHRRLLGIAPGARIFAVKAFDESASSAEATSFQILKGLDWAISKGVRIVNMSFAGPRDLMMGRVLETAFNKGIVLIAAAGNAGPTSPPLYPAADPKVIAVSATDYADRPFVGANRGKHIAVAAPGVDVLVPAPGGSYQMTTGTSVAAAEVSGVAALLLERHPSLTPTEVRAVLMKTARSPSIKMRDDQLGAGLVDPGQALASLTSQSAEPAPRVPAVPVARPVSVAAPTAPGAR